jgi:hypothetical protein
VSIVVKRILKLLRIILFIIAHSKKQKQAYTILPNGSDCLHYLFLAFFPESTEHYGIAAGLLTRLNQTPSRFHSGDCLAFLRGLQQRVLSLIFTGFPFHPAL